MLAGVAVRAVAAVCALCVATCGAERDAPVVDAEPEFDASSPAGLTTPLYRSGSRLKIRWVTAGGDVRFVHAIFDTKLHRVCEVEQRGNTFVCVPAADASLRHEDIAYVDGDGKGPARLVDAAECAADRADTTLYAPSLYPGEKVFPNLFTADAPRLVSHAWLAAGGGCVPQHEEAFQKVCVRPLRFADLDLVTFRASVLGKNADGSGVIVAVGDDGSILPRQSEPTYRDAPHGIDCSVDDELCLPRDSDQLEGTPVVGSEVRVTSYSLGGHRWATNKGKTTWAALSGPSIPFSNHQLRFVRSLFAPEDALRMPRVVTGNGRIVLRARVMPDGRRVPLGLHDTLLAQDCVATKMDDGTVRCTPLVPLLCNRVSQPPDWHPVALSTDCSSDKWCCHGGTFWFPGRAAEQPQRYGIGPHAEWIPATTGYGVRFANEPTSVTFDWHYGGMQPFTSNVYAKIGDVTADAFAKLEVIEDR